MDDLLDGTGERPLDGPVVQLTVEGYGHHWFRIRRAGRRLAP